MKQIISFFLLFHLAAAQADDSFSKAQDQLQKIHSSLRFSYGSLQDEYPEQLMAALFIPPEAQVLELGGNIGRNSCVIASLLKNSKNLVTMECSKESAKLLRKNRDRNKLQFRIEEAAISKVPLIQSGWMTIPSEEEKPGFVRVNTLSFEEVQKKYRMTFDTLVIDCEGAFYYILKDDPELLKNIRLILMENDFPLLEHFQYVTKLLQENGFQLIYTAPLMTDWQIPAKEEFYQAWKKH